MINTPAKKTALGSNGAHILDNCSSVMHPVNYSELNDQEKDQILTLQQTILEAMLQDQGSSLKIIDHVCLLEEQLLPNSVGSVMLFDETSQQLNLFAAPSIPATARQKFSGIRPGASAGSCGNVLFRREPVFVSNTLEDPRWQDLRHLAQDLNLMACWSMPIYGRNEQIIGTFALSSFEQRSPSSFHLKLLEIGASIIGIVLERHEQFKSQQLNARIFEHSGEAIIITDATQRVISINPTFNQMFGYQPEDIVGQVPNVLKSDHHQPLFYQTMWRVLKQNGYWQDEIWNKARDGSVRPYLLGISAIHDSAGKISYFVGIYSNISKYKQAQAQIEFLAYHDPLTKLPNRLLAKDRAELAILAARNNQNQIALLMLDIDHFKNINDSLSHSVGDELILRIAQRVQDCLHDTDTLSRTGGDEFLIILPLINDTEHISQLLNNVMGSMNPPFIIHDTELTITLSVGVAIYPDDGTDFDALLKAADIAMYRAKASGRNGWRFFTDELNQDAQDRIRLTNSLRQGLSQQQFHLHYQPQIDLASNAIIGVEALLRWRHPVLGDIPPNRFIPIAEDNGIIIQIGEWVLNEACRQVMAWQKAGAARLRIAVNLSAIQFTRSNLVAIVARALETSGLDPALLELELTESILMHNTEQILEAVQQLKRMGVQLSIDDFGTGYSSLSYLKRFNVDRLKIDQSFVRDMTNDSSDFAIVRAIIQMAKGLNLKTIAEGVEHGEQLAMLIAEQCDEAQGYFISRPVPAEAFMQWCEQYRATPKSPARNRKSHRL